MLNNEKIQDLQEILEIKQTGQFDKDTVEKLDKYIKESNFTNSKEANDLAKRNSNFGISSEHTINDIRNLAVNLIVDKYNNDFQNDLLNLTSEFISNRLDKDIDIINTFVENEQEELAIKYANGGLLGFIKFDDGGQRNPKFKLKASEMAELIENNPELRNIVAGQMGIRSEARLKKAISAMRNDPNIEYEIKDDGQIDVAGKTNAGGYSAAQGLRPEYKGSVKEPGLGKRLITSKENKVEKALKGVEGLSPELRQKLFSKYAQAGTTEQTTNATTENTTKTCGEGTKEYPEFPGECLTEEGYNYKKLSGTQNTGTNTPANNSTANPANTNTGGGNAGGPGNQGKKREADFAGLTDDEKTMYKFYWNTNGGGNPENFGTTQEKIHAMLMGKIAAKDANYQSNLASIRKQGNSTQPGNNENEAMGGAGYSSSNPYNNKDFEGLPEEQSTTKPKETDEIGSGVATATGVLGTLYAGKKIIGDALTSKNPTKGIMNSLSDYLSSIGKKATQRDKIITPSNLQSSTINTPYNTPPKMLQLNAGKQTLTPDQQIKADEMIKESKINTGTVTNPKASLPNAQVLVGGKKPMLALAEAKKTTTALPTTQRATTQKAIVGKEAPLQLGKGKNTSTYVQDVMDKTGLDRTQLAQKVSKMTGKPLRHIKDEDILAVSNRGKLAKGGRLYQQGGDIEQKYMGSVKERMAVIDNELNGIMQKLNEGRDTKQGVAGTRSYSNVANNTDLAQKDLRRRAQQLIYEKKKLGNMPLSQKNGLSNSLLSQNQLKYKKGGMMNILFKKHQTGGVWENEDLNADGLPYEKVTDMHGTRHIGRVRDEDEYAKIKEEYLADKEFLNRIKNDKSKKKTYDHYLNQHNITMKSHLSDLRHYLKMNPDPEFNLEGYRNGGALKKKV